MDRTSCLLSGKEIVQYQRSASKELPEVGVKLYEPSGSWFEENKLSNALDERYSLLKEPRIEKDSVLSVARWDEMKKKVFVVKKKGKELETYGHHDSKDNLYYLNPEEALFLLESKSLALFNGNIEMSIEICYSLLLSQEAGCTLDQYRVFSHLSRLGYKLIRHKKPDSTCKTVVNIPQPENTSTNPNYNRSSTRPTTVELKSRSSVAAENTEEIVLIDDSSSDSDIVILDVIKGRSNEVINIDDNDSRDSDIISLDGSDRVELPLENWGYVHHSKFLNTCSNNDNETNVSIHVDPLIIAQPQREILNSFPNIRGRHEWLFRPDETLIPDGVWPFHYKYLIGLDIKRNNNYRGRGRFHRGRGRYLQRQVYQMKNYTISLVNMISQMMGGNTLEMIPPPPFLQTSNLRGQPCHYMRGRARWGRISFCNRGTNYHRSNVPIDLLGGDEESSNVDCSVKRENIEELDIKPKRIKLDPDSISIDSNGSIKMEPVDVKVEINTNTAMECSNAQSQVNSETESLVTSQNVTSENISQCLANPKQCLSNDVSVKTKAKTNCEGDANTSSKCDTEEMEQCSPDNCISVDDSDNSKDKSDDISDCSSITKVQPLPCNSVDTSNQDTELLCNSPDTSNQGTELSCNSPDTSNQVKNVSDNSPDTSNQGTELPCNPPDTLNQVNNLSDNSPDTPNQVKNVSGNSPDISNQGTELSCNSPDTSNQVKNVSDNSPDTSNQGTELPCNSPDTLNQVKNLSDNSPDTPNQVKNVSDNSPDISNQGTELSCNSPDTSNQVKNVSDNTPDISNQVVKVHCNLSDMSNQVIELSCHSHDSSNQTIESSCNSADTPCQAIENTNTCEPLSESRIEKEMCWKELKNDNMNDKTLSLTDKCTKLQENNLENDADEDVDYGSPLIDNKHCKSIDEVLKRLQIFSQYKSKKELSETDQVEVKYDVYLPSSSYLRNLPSDPDFRLIILRLEDNLPDAEQMLHLRKIYNDNKNFLFAVILQESIAYYLYDSVFLPIDNKT